MQPLLLYLVAHMDCTVQDKIPTIYHSLGSEGDTQPHLSQNKSCSFDNSDKNLSEVKGLEPQIIMSASFCHLSMYFLHPHCF